MGSPVTSVSVVIPVRDGERYLSEVLEAVLDQAGSVSGTAMDVLVVDSGSTDGSVGIARAGGARVLEVAPADFGHGRTRNLAAEHTTGDAIVFLTQDATPLEGWLDALIDGFALGDDVGVVYGPHRARPDTSPMIARELEGFFAGHAGPDGGPAVQRASDPPWLSNVNAAYRRDCWSAIRFDDRPYAEDQAFGQAMLTAGWAKVFHPAAAVAHAHDYAPVPFACRYFDEYRGLRETVGHVEPLGLRRAAGDVRGLVAADRAWMREQAYDAAALRRWTTRALVHHSSRKVFGALGSRAEALPPAVQRRLSLEGTVAERPSAVAHPGPPVGATSRRARSDRPGGASWTSPAPAPRRCWPRCREPAPAVRCTWLWSSRRLSAAPEGTCRCSSSSCVWSAWGTTSPCGSMTRAG